MATSSVGVFAATEPVMLHDEELGYEVSLDTPSDSLDLPYDEGLGYRVDLEDEAIATRGYDSGWKDFLGGKWRHGVDNKYVWSQYKHSSKTHKTTVRGAGGKYSTSDWVKKGVVAKASWEKAVTGNKAWADTK
jgi:hypothetical protein